MASTDPSIHLTVHVKDETVIEAQRVNSSDRDFVALKVGFPVGILLFNPAQAKALGQAAAEAFKILSEIDTQEAAAEMVRSMTGSGYTECTISNPCQDCRDLEDSYNYPEWEYEEEPF